MLILDPHSILRWPNARVNISDLNLGCLMWASGAKYARLQLEQNSKSTKFRLCYSSV
jgi:hypothetical protein